MVFIVIKSGHLVSDISFSPPHEVERHLRHSFFAFEQMVLAVSILEPVPIFSVLSIPQA
jgi:hypothetical protein